MLQAEQEITKAKADAAVVTAQDKVALLKARFDVRRAELTFRKTNWSAASMRTKMILHWSRPKRVLAELEQDVKSRSVSNQATILLAEEKRNKAKLAMDQAQGNIDKMRVVFSDGWSGCTGKKRGGHGRILLLPWDDDAGISRRRPG